MARPATRFDLVTLRLFLTALEESSITRAAAREHLTASAVSKRLSELEAQLAVQLFERHSNGVQLTAAGRALEADARSVFAALERMQQLAADYASGARGEVRLHANASSIVDTLPEELRRFSRRHPHIQIRMDEGRSTEVVESVASGRADVGIFVPNVPAPDLEVVPYRSVTLTLLAPADHPLADSIRAAFKLAETEVPSDVIGLWLAQKVMPALTAVPLRDSGGVYFVPKDQQIALNLIAKVLEASSGHALHRIPAMRSADAVAAILDAIQAEAEKESAQLEADALSDDLGPRAFRGRIKVADALRAKVESYETLLGSNLDALKERIEKLRAALTIAEVRAASDDATA